MFPFIIEEIRSENAFSVTPILDWVAKLEPHMQGLWLQEHCGTCKLFLKIIREVICNSELASSVILVLYCLFPVWSSLPEFVSTQLPSTPVSDHLVIIPAPYFAVSWSPALA